MITWLGASRRGGRLLFAGSGLLFLVTTICVASYPTRVHTAPLNAIQAAASDLYTDVYNGWKWWHVYCYRCHGVNAVGTSTAPNLIDPNVKITRAAFVRTVRDGVPDKGMQAWNQLLDQKQINQLYVYVRARAEKVLPPGRPDEIGLNGGVWVPPAGWSPR